MNCVQTYFIGRNVLAVHVSPHLHLVLNTLTLHGPFNFFFLIFVLRLLSKVYNYAAICGKLFWK